VQKTRGSAVYLDERTLAVIHAGAVQIVDVDRGAVVEVLESPDGGQQLRSLALSPDGRQLAVGGDRGSFWLYDLRRRQWTSGGRAAAAPVLCMEFIWPHQWLALGTQDATIAVWDLRLGRMRHQLDGHRGPVAALAWSAVEQRLASAGLSDGGVVRLWDVELGQQVSAFHTDPDCQLHDAEFSPDGRALAVCGVVPPYEAFVFRWRIGDD
jgi:WD40 repeat protein